MTASRKVTRWDGPNKRKARARKLLLAEQERRNGLLPEHPTALTFAGARAHFERGLVGRRLVRAKDIVTIQTSQRIGGHNGGEILHKLIKMRDSYLRGMSIWPHTFHSFSTGYVDQPTTIPAFTSAHQAPQWFRSPKFRKEMYDFLGKKKRDGFSIIDADICGIFSEANATDIIRLMRDGAFADKGLLFVNHLKGRDGRFGKLFSFLREYFHYCDYFDVDSLTDEYGDRLDMSSEDELSFYWIRYVLVPIFYVCEAFKTGYRLEVLRLVEYRDKNPNTRAGVNMLQWYFRFNRLRSHKLIQASQTPSVRILRDERKSLKDSLDIIAREAYPYTSSVD